MKIIHTADWHLCARLGRHDRGDDLRTRIERVAAYCEEHWADVLAIAGDLFDDARPEEMAESLNHLHRTFRGFLDRGGTILAVTGNHDSDARVDLVRAGMSLVTTPTASGGELSRGRVYLLNRCFFARLRSVHGDHVQFVLVPYPFAHRYDLPSGYRSREELNTLLQARVAEWVQSVPEKAGFDPTLPTVLVAHLHLSGAEMKTRYKITPREDVLIAPAMVNPHWAYVALGHIHQAQHLPGLPNVRYSGPLDRLDFGEIDDDRGVWLVDVGPTALRGDPVWLPLDPTPMLDLNVATEDDLATVLAHPLRETAFARITVTARDLSRDDTERELKQAFPRWHQINWAADTPVCDDTPSGINSAYCTADVAGTVRAYLEREIRADHPDRQSLFDLADRYLEEATRDSAAR